MNEEEIAAINAQSQTATNTQQAAQIAAQTAEYQGTIEKGLAETQLDVNQIINEVYHLLKQDIFIIENGMPGWKELESVQDRILTDKGVERIMQVVKFYVNKNTLLSNFNDVQINTLMLRFVTELNDLILLKYQYIFREPTFEECKGILNSRIDEKAKLKVYAAEIVGKTLEKEDVKKEMLEEIEFKIEKEIEKIKQESRKEKLRDYGLMMAQLETMIFSTLNRAWKGEERGSIRRHTNISEVIGSSPLANKNDGGMFKWLKN